MHPWQAFGFTICITQNAHELKLLSQRAKEKPDHENHLLTFKTSACLTSLDQNALNDATSSTYILDVFTLINSEEEIFRSGPTAP